MEPTSPFTHSPVAGPTHQVGYSLVEVMVAAVIGLLLLLGVTNVVINGSRIHRELSQSGEQMENGRYAIQLLSDDVKHAGFYGEFSDLQPFAGGSLPDPCATDPAALELALPLALQGYDAPPDGTNPLTCLVDADHIGGTDILVVRRTETKLAQLASLQAGAIYLQTHTDDYELNKGDDPSVFTILKKDGATPANIRRYRADIYFISPCNRPTTDGGSCDSGADDGHPVPTLKRRELTHDGTTTVMKTVPLVAGIEDLQIDWGIDRSGDGAPNESNPGTSGDDYLQAPANLDEWANVVAVRLYVLARNIERSTQHQDAKTYDFGKSGTRSFSGAAAAYKRHLFSGTVRAINISSRRER